MKRNDNENQTVVDEDDMSASSVRVEVPATTANLGSGFDCLGLALDLWNTFDVRLKVIGDVKGGEDDRLLWILPGKTEFKGEGSEDLSSGKNNLFFRAIERGLVGDPVVKTLGQSTGRPDSYVKVDVIVNNSVPLSSGLGSSATAIIAGLLVANALRSQPYDNDWLLNLATEMEGHPDNVAAALLGGLTVCAVNNERSNMSSGDESVATCVEAVSLDPPESLWVTVAVPDFYVGTGDARATLPSRVMRSEAVFNLSRAALWVAAVASGQLEKIGTATEDKLHQSYRSSLIPGLDNIFKAAKAAGALGVALSGAGPSVVAFSYHNVTEKIGSYMEEAFRKVGVTARIFTLRPNATGATVRRRLDEDERTFLFRTDLAGGL